MIDNIPMHLHYRAFFNIAPKRQLDNAWGDLITEIRRWMNVKTTKEEQVFGGWFYRGNLGKPKIYKNGLKITIASNIGNGTEKTPQHWAAQLEEPCKEYPKIRSWKTDIGVTVSEYVFEISLIVSHSIRSGYIGVEPPTPDPTTPLIVSNFLSSELWQASAGTEELSSTPRILDSGDVPEFIKILESQSRLCPVVYVSRDYYSNEPLINVDKLANLLAGNAIVFLAGSSALDKETEHLLPADYRCWNGMIRVYQPKLNLHAKTESNRHRYFVANEITQSGADNIITLLVKGISRRSIIWKKPEICSLSDISYKYRSNKILELTKNKENTTADEWIVELENVMLDRDIWKSDNDILCEDILEIGEKLDEANQELHRKEFERTELSHQVDIMRNSLKASESKISTFSVLDRLPRNLFEVCEIIENFHSENIVFTDQAKKSAKEADWVDVGIAWSCLWQVATTLHNLFFLETDKPVDIEKEFNNRTGFELAMTEGKQTKNDAKLLKKREIDYKGSTIDIGPHIKYGNKKPKMLRVYFCPHPASGKIIVGHCGDHLENHSSKFRK